MVEEYTESTTGRVMMSDAWVKANSRHPDNCREYDVIFADVAGEKVAELEAELERQEAYYMGERQQLAELREAIVSHRSECLSEAELEDVLDCDRKLWSVLQGEGHE